MHPFCTRCFRRGCGDGGLRAGSCSGAPLASVGLNPQLSRWRTLLSPADSLLELRVASQAGGAARARRGRDRCARSPLRLPDTEPNRRPQTHNDALDQPAHDAHLRRPLPTRWRACQCCDGARRRVPALTPAGTCCECYRAAGAVGEGGGGRGGGRLHGAGGAGGGSESGARQAARVADGARPGHVRVRGVRRVHQLHRQRAAPPGERF